LELDNTHNVEIWSSVASSDKTTIPSSCVLIQTNITETQKSEI